jgi:hypothetical protein
MHQFRLTQLLQNPTYKSSLLLFNSILMTKTTSYRHSAPFRFEPYEGTLDEWGEVLKTFPDYEIFQTPEWIRFLADSQGARPVVAALKDRNDTVGYFAGLTVRKFGLKILGSPFVGWTTERMGLRLRSGAPRREALNALLKYAFHDLGCVHIELTDTNYLPDDVAGLGFQSTVSPSFMLDLAADEDRLWRNMSATSARYRIRKAEKEGVIIEEASDDSFADEYYSQLCDVFAKQKLVPTYGKDRVQLLIRHLLPTGNLLLLRVREPQGQCIATGIFFGLNQTSYFWGNASWRQHQHFSPNEAIQWHAIRHWKRQGMRWHDFCGGGGYKKKYGCDTIERFTFRKSKYPWLPWARNLAAKGFRWWQRYAGAREESGNPQIPTEGLQQESPPAEGN